MVAAVAVAAVPATAVSLPFLLVVFLLRSQLFVYLISLPHGFVSKDNKINTAAVRSSAPGVATYIYRPI